MKIWQTWVRGPRTSWLGDGTFLSREVFLTEREALAHVPTLSERSIGPKPYDLEEITSFGTQVLELVGAGDLTDAVLGLDRKLDVLVSAMPDSDRALNDEIAAGFAHKTTKPDSDQALNDEIAALDRRLLARRPVGR